MKKRILMIDDDPHMHRIVGIYLKNKPYELVNVHSARMALHKLDERPFDLILSDIQMPGMDGIELIKMIKAKYPDLPIIVLSAFDSERFRQEFTSFAALSILPKPFDQRTLSQLIERYMEEAENEGD